MPIQHNEDFLLPYLPKARLQCAVQVGAHEGLWIERFVPLFKRIIAIEANPATAETLRRKNLPGVEVLDGAGWIDSGHDMDFHIRGGTGMGCALACRDIMRDHAVDHTIKVTTVALDDIPMTALDLLWVDVEGAELQVLMGATRKIEAWKPDLILEFHEREHRDWAVSWLERCGYNLAIVHEPHRELHDDFARHSYLIAQHWRFRGSW